MILIVEDDASHAELIRFVFEDNTDEKLDIIFAGSVAQAKHLLTQNLPSLVICDWILPDGHGTDLIPSDRENAPMERMN